MSTHILSVALSAVLLIGSSTLYAAEGKPSESPTKPDKAQMKKHCDEMMKNMDMSKMSAAEHEAMMKRCMEGKQPDSERKPDNPPDRG